MPGLMDSLPAGTLNLMAGYAALLVVPGPSMIVVSAANIAARGREGMTTALGVAVGTGLLVFATIYACGVLGQAADLGTVAPLLFGITMFYLGLRLVRQALRPCVRPIARPDRATRGHFLIGMVTALTNPISFVFFSTAAMSLPDTDDELLLAAPVCIFLMALAWFSLVGRIAGRAAGRALPHRIGATARAGAGAILIVISARTLVDTLGRGGLI